MVLENMPANTIKLMLERQKFALYQQEMLLESAKICTLPAGDAARECKNHSLPAGYAPLAEYAAKKAKMHTQPAEDV